MNKKLKVLLIIFVCLLFAFPTFVKANIICNDGSQSPSCSYCHPGCCSWHGGCTSTYKNYDEDYDEEDYDEDYVEDYVEDYDEEDKSENTLLVIGLVIGGIIIISFLVKKQDE